MSDHYDPDLEGSEEFLPVLAEDNRPAIFLSSLPRETREQQQFLHWVLTSPAPNVKDALKEKLAITDILIHPVEVTNTVTGEMQQLNRVVLVCQKGKEQEIYASSSTGIYRSVRQLLDIYGPAPWEPPIVVMPVDITTKNNRTYRVLTTPKPGSK